jgi:hypothetical protein
MWNGSGAARERFEASTYASPRMHHE